MEFVKTLLEEQKELLTEELRFAEDLEYAETKQRLTEVTDALNKLFICGVINWVAVSEKLPTRMDEDYLVCVRNKNKEGGIPIQDIGNFSSDGVWIKQNAWEDVVYWAELPKPPCL